MVMADESSGESSGEEEDENLELGAMEMLNLKLEAKNRAEMFMGSYSSEIGEINDKVGELDSLLENTNDKNWETLSLSLISHL